MGFGSLNHDTTTSYRLSHTPFFLKLPHLHMYYGIRVYPYAHPQLIKVLKHFVYIQYRGGIQTMGVCSLNHDTTTSYRLSHTPFFLKLPPPAHVLRHTPLNHFVYPIWMWDTVNGGLQPHHNIIQAQLHHFS